MRPLRAAVRAVGTAAVGGLLAAAYVVGTSTAGDPSLTAPAVGSAPLRLGEYCRSVYGERADGYAPRNLDGWRCSAWNNGVWGLEDVDLAAVCRWQEGPDARLQTTPRTDDPGDEAAGNQAAAAASRLRCAP